MDVNVASQGGQNAYNYADSSVGKTQSIQTSSVNQVSGEYVQKNKNAETDMVSVKDAKIAVDKLNKLLEGKPTHIEYEEDKTFKQVMVMRVVDNDTHEVVNQIPSKEVLDMLTQFCEMAGLILDKKA